MYETWLITELCDRGSLASLVHSRRMGSADPAHRSIWVLLCLLDVALGLEYLHSNTIVSCGGAGEGVLVNRSSQGACLVHSSQHCCGQQLGASWRPLLPAHANIPSALPAPRRRSTET